MKRPVILSFVFLSAIISTNSAAGVSQFYGSGLESCGEWVSARKKDDWYQMGQWMLGFISAAGYYGPDNLKKSDSQAFAVWMDNYCQANPLSSFESGVKKLVVELKNRH